MTNNERYSLRKNTSLSAGAAESPCPGKGSRELSAKDGFSRPSPLCYMGSHLGFFSCWGQVNTSTAIHRDFFKESTYFPYADSKKCVFIEIYLNTFAFTLNKILMSQPQELLFFLETILKQRIHV